MTQEHGEDSETMTTTRDSPPATPPHTTTTAVHVQKIEEYVPPKVWKWEQPSSGKFKFNRPFSGPTHQKELPVGKHPLQLYSMGTPNGIKVTILLEEIQEIGGPTLAAQGEYDAWLIDFIEGEQFGSGFASINPNSKIPALVDHQPKQTSTNGATTSIEPIRIFESGAILLYLAEKLDNFLIPPTTDIAKRAECMSWLFWQMGSGGFIGGGFGHFYRYAPSKQEYPINRYTMEVKRQLDVLDKNLATRKYMIGDEYTIADIAIWPWYGDLVLGRLYEAAEFLDVSSYPNLLRWARDVGNRPAVQRGYKVNRTWGRLEDQLHERHDASDFINKTQDKLQKPIEVSTVEQDGQGETNAKKRCETIGTTVSTSELQTHTKRIRVD